MRVSERAVKGEGREQRLQLQEKPQLSESRARREAREVRALMYVMVSSVPG